MNAYTKETLPPWPILPQGFGGGKDRPFDAAAIVARRDQIAIGAIVFREEDNRVYLRDGRNYSGSPIYRYRFVAYRVAGETRVSWLLEGYPGEDLNRCGKIPKKDLSKIFGRDDVEDQIWRSANARRIADQMQRISVPMLRMVAKLIGYEPPEGPQS